MGPKVILKNDLVIDRSDKICSNWFCIGPAADFTEHKKLEARRNQWSWLKMKKDGNGYTGWAWLQRHGGSHDLERNLNLTEERLKKTLVSREMNFHWNAIVNPTGRRDLFLFLNKCRAPHDCAHFFTKFPTQKQKNKCLYMTREPTTYIINLVPYN